MSDGQFRKVLRQQRQNAIDLLVKGGFTTLEAEEIQNRRDAQDESEVKNGYAFDRRFRSQVKNSYRGAVVNVG